MNKLVEQVKTIWANLTPGRRYVTLGLLVAVIIGFTWIILSQTTANWTTVASRMNAEDLKAAGEALQDKKIPVRLQEDGSLQVPRERLDEARLELAIVNSTSGGVGMELFNESTFGQSAFQEMVNYHRALEGELGRTIRSIEGVVNARVHLVIPKKRLFKKDQLSPTASVKLNLKRGIEITSRQIKGIRALVSSAIAGLKANHVSIIDQRGNILAMPSEAGEAGKGNYMQIRLAYERNLEQRIKELLDPLVGQDKVRAQVSAEMDFSRVEITEKNLDPEMQVVKSEERASESSNSTDPTSTGVPGVAGNMPGRVQAASGKLTSSRTSKKESVKYETSSSVKRTQLPVGRLKKLSVAVVVDGKMVAGKEGAATWKARTPKEMKQFTELVSKAVGIDSTRGDQLAVINTRFEPVVVIEETDTPGLPVWADQSIKWGSLLLLALLFVFGVVGPIVRAAKSQSGRVPLGGQLIDGQPGGRDARLDVITGALPSGPGPKASGERMRLQAIESTKDDPKRAAQIIRAWLMVEE
jgi:flagellar M-ring protein FliF